MQHLWHHLLAHLDAPRRWKVNMLSHIKWQFFLEYINMSQMITKKFTPILQMFYNSFSNPTKRWTVFFLLQFKSMKLVLSIIRHTNILLDQSSIDVQNPPFEHLVFFCFYCYITFFHFPYVMLSVEGFRFQGLQWLSEEA